MVVKRLKTANADLKKQVNDLTKRIEIMEADARLRASSRLEIYLVK